MKHTSPLKVTTVCVTFLVGAASVSYAGPLNPPAGPVASSYKTLTEVEPRITVNATNTPGNAGALFRITQPGSYYLAGNITGVSGLIGIEIVASGVTLDLMGFELLGVPGSSFGIDTTLGGATNIAVVNGSIRNWGSTGVALANVSNTRLENLRASGNTGAGIFASDNAVITRCVATQNGASGISVQSSGTITDCAVSSNTGNGINTQSNFTITGCTATFNSLSGINTGAFCTITGCTAVANTQDGIRVTAGCIVSGNNCSGNGNAGDGAGVHATGADNRIEGNNCINADRGVDVDAAGNIIIANTCSGNTTDWDIAANNIYGPIIDRRTPASAAVVGFSAASTLGSADAFANFSY